MAKRYWNARRGTYTDADPDKPIQNVIGFILALTVVVVLWLYGDELFPEAPSFSVWPF